MHACNVAMSNGNANASQVCLGGRPPCPPIGSVSESDIEIPQVDSVELPLPLVTGIG